MWCKKKMCILPLCGHALDCKKSMWDLLFVEKYSLHLKAWENIHYDQFSYVILKLLLLRDHSEIYQIEIPGNYTWSKTDVNWRNSRFFPLLLDEIRDFFREHLTKFANFFLWTIDEIHNFFHDLLTKFTIFFCDKLMNMACFFFPTTD